MNLQHLVRTAFPLFVLGVLFAGCVTYSPYVNLPSSPIDRGEGEAGASVSGLVRTGAETEVETGLEAFGRYGFSNTFSLGLRTWTDNMDFGDGRVLSGFSFDGLFNLSDREQSVRYGLSTRLLFLFEDRTLEAEGLLLNGVAWLPDLWLLKPFAAVGGGIGYDLDPDPEDREFVFIATAHAGAAIELFEGIEARTELAYVSEFNRPGEYDVTWWLVPTFTVAWRF